ncbi:hypothetical protein [Aequorivita sp. Q41]|uniref:hypothetical protein n=1 Tax=Aequorivita sp. Q41 TaxID=3153300 RepID=UPI003242790B
MKNLLLLAVLFTFATLSAQENCDNFKTGNFRMSDPAISFECTITRNDSIQVEKIVGTNELSTYKVAWLTPCEYTLQLIDGPPEAVAFYKDRFLKVKITSTHEDSYTFEAKMDGMDFVATQTIYKVE